MFGAAAFSQVPFSASKEITPYNKWESLDSTQTATWVALTDTQSPAWGDIIDTQNPLWVNT